ncbi:MAG: hypothetical protein LBS25_08040, partial [Candidatus Symbiothrix sp.]|nr:hypothetical protein [Candidatus Symbiothrix sp.]
MWFRSHEYSSEKRTSLALCPEKQFHFSSGFELSFDIQLRKELHNYGYIFRIIGNDSVAFDLLSNFNGGKRSLVLTYRNNSSIPFESADLSAYRYGEWVPVVFRLDSRKKEITVSFMGKEIKSAYHSSALKSFRIFFGYCDFQRFKSTEVPPMTIKNIRLLDHQKRQIASWELKKHGFNISYDDLHDLPAIACNPVWEVDRHIIWKKEKAFSAPAHTQVAGNHEEGVVYFANQQFILKYDLEKNKMDTIFPAGGNPYKERANQMIYHPFYNELWSYDFDKQTISRYLFDRNLWTNGDKELKNPLYSQHNSFISPADSCLYVFGGYGEYRYKNSLLKKGVSGKWTLVNYKGSITPRFLASAGLKGKDTLLLLGGYGHPSGKQELGPENYYDLYELDLKNFVMSKRWKLNDISRDFVHANAMIIDEQTKQAFSLCIDNNKTKSYMILKSFDLSTGANHEFADTIPCTFDTVNSFCTLYYNKNNNRLYAINLHNDEEKSEIKVYSLACPPFDPKQIYQSEKDTHLVFGNKYWIAGIIASLLTVCFFIFRNRKNSRQKRLVISEIKDVNLDRITVNDKIPSSVNFIGRFQVFDKTKADVTSL